MVRIATCTTVRYGQEFRVFVVDGVFLDAPSAISVLAIGLLLSMLPGMS